MEVRHIPRSLRVRNPDSYTRTVEVDGTPVHIEERGGERPRLYTVAGEEMGLEIDAFEREDEHVLGHIDEMLSAGD